MKLTAKIKAKQTFMRDVSNALTPPMNSAGLVEKRIGKYSALMLIEPASPYYVRVLPKISEQKVKQRY
ncbi:MAG: hypothetical protein HOO95_07305 [Gallionella sp.]|nr:hypothetical protein [Gallionella sp.]